MNTLYGILTWNTTPSSGYEYYVKRTDNLLINNKQQAIREVMLTGVPEGAEAFFAAVICDLVRYTNYGAEILRLDSNNTYTQQVRPPDANHSDPAYSFQALIQPVDVYKQLGKYLDDDLTATMNKESFLDWMAAGALQLLREANK